MVKKNNHIEQYLNKLYQHPSDRAEAFLQIPIEQRADVFLRLRRSLQYQILRGLPKELTIELLEKLDPDDATDALQLYDKRKREKLLMELSGDIQEQLATLLKFNESTAGGLMTLDYIQVNTNETIADAAKKFKLHEKRTGKPPEIIALEMGRVVGYVPGYELGFARAGEKIKKYIKNIKTVHSGVTDKQVVDKFRSHPHNKLVVLDDNESVLGIIYSDDVLKVLKEQEGAMLYDFAGISDEEDVSDPARLKIKFRYKWLILNLATAFLAAFTVGLFENTLQKYVLLAVYMPIIAGMGGNAGTQTLAVMVRGITLKQINFGNFMRPLIAELTAGFVNGVINGILVFGVVIALSRDVRIAAVMAIAMIFNLLVAALFGTLIPLTMKRMGKDPASSATIFITTATDVLGFLAFLGLATVVLR
jgi:magnesium transporter